MHTCTHTISHKQADSWYVLYSHLCTHILYVYNYIYNVMHLHTVEYCTEHYSSFPLSFAQRGAELVQHLVAVLW